MTAGSEINTSEFSWKGGQSPVQAQGDSQLEPEGHPALCKEPLHPTLQRGKLRLSGTQASSQGSLGLNTYACVATQQEVYS